MPKPLHVLHVITTLGRGGAERQLADLLAHTDGTRYKHTVAYLRPPDDLAAEMRRYGHAVVDLGVRGKYGWLAAARRLRALAREREVDVVHTTLFDANLSARLAHLAGMRLPIVTSLVSTEYDPASVRLSGWNPAKVAAYRWADRLSARAADASFVACSRAVERSATEQLAVSPSKMSVIYCSVDPATIAYQQDEVAALRRKHDIGEDDIVYLNIGRMDAPKAQEHLLRAFARVAGDHPRALLAMVGGGVLESELHRLGGALGIQERIRWVGRTPRIGPVLALANVYVFPSVLEGMPVSLLEAMFAGLACIVSDIPPHRELIEDGRTGLICPVGDIEGYARAMATLYADAPLRVRLGAAARRAVCDVFDTHVTTRQWEQLFMSLSSLRDSVAASPRTGLFAE